MRAAGRADRGYGLLLTVRTVGGKPTKAGPYRTARPICRAATALVWLLLLGRIHLCDQTLERLERLLGEIGVESGNLF